MLEWLVVVLLVVLVVPFVVPAHEGDKGAVFVVASWNEDAVWVDIGIMLRVGVGVSAGSDDLAVGALENHLRCWFLGVA
jgi:hypothetical protein